MIEHTQELKEVVFLIDRIIVVVLDSVGIGALPDANKFNDEGSNTLVNTAKATGGLNLPNLAKMGLGNLDSIPGVLPEKNPIACYGKMSEVSNGKDTTTGHWEMAGIILRNPFPTYPNGFPEEVIRHFEQSIGRKVLGNVVASGTEIIKKLGIEHMNTGNPIVYTSADSVFQIAAHEDVISVDELYRMCTVARRILTGKHSVARVIARPFIGTSPDNFTRTDKRKDFSISPPDITVLDMAIEKNFVVYAIGKIQDIFNGKGISKSVHTSGNAEGIKEIINAIKLDFKGIIFANLGDFDTLYGHRNNPIGYKRALEEFDKSVPEIMNTLKDSDFLIITADHGCDPTTPSTDHSREYTPLLVYSKNPSFIPAKSLGVRETFADVGATIAKLLNLGTLKNGSDFSHICFKTQRR